MSPLSWQASKIHRVCRSPASAETRAAADGEDELYAVPRDPHECVRPPTRPVRTIQGTLISDSKCLYDRLQQTALTSRGEEKRSDIESFGLKDAIESTSLCVRWVHEDAQLANSLTKDNEYQYQQILLFQSLHGRWRMTFDAQLMSGRRRRQLPMHPLH